MFIHKNTPKYKELSTKIVNGQRWYIVGDVKYPSVTTVLGQKEKPWLDDWKNMLGTKKAAKETKRCGERGTAVHKMAENYLNNIEDPTEGFDQKHIYQFNKLKLRLNNINNIRVQEVPLYSHTLKIAGRVDVVAEYDDVLSVIDFKTSNNYKNINMIEDYRLQCCAYSLCWFEMFGELIDNYTILVAVEKGLISQAYTGKITPYISELKKRIDTFYTNLKHD